MAAPRLPGRLRGRMAARTIRMRLTLLYGVVFLVTGALLLTSGFLLVRHNIDTVLIRHNIETERSFRNDLQRMGVPISVLRQHRHLSGLTLREARLVRQIRRQFAEQALNRLLAEYIAALLLMTAVSVLAGWMLAGRALAPLRAITATARRVSAQNLGERIDLRGPADELKELADTFDRMLARLDQTFAAQRQFVANASHELRTPLAIMRTEIDVALADPAAGAEELRQTAEAVRDAIDRSEGLIAALLTLARSGVITASERAVALEQLCADCVTDLGHRARERRIAVETDLRRATVQGDPDLLERLVGNLLENAVKHNRPGGRLLIATRTETHDGASFAVLRVENGGAVITPEQAAGLTEPFRRLTRAGPGFGLGLSIVRSVAEAHGGRVELRARPQGGLEVLVTLSALEEEPLDRGTLDAVASRRRSLEDAAGFTGR